MLERGVTRVISCVIIRQIPINFPEELLRILSQKKPLITKVCAYLQIIGQINIHVMQKFAIVLLFLSSYYIGLSPRQVNDHE